MVRKNAPAPRPKPPGAPAKLNNRRPSAAERSAYFARREAAKVLRSVLQGDARRRAFGSIKSLVYSPSVKNKKATFALVSQTLKHLPIIKDVLESANLLNSKWKRQEELIYVIAYDVLFGKEVSLVGGDAEKFIMRRKDALEKALAQLLVRKNVKHVDGLIPLYLRHDISKPCYVRVNTLKSDVDSTLIEFAKQFTVQKDDMLPELLILPPHTDLHNHPLVLNGSVFIQGKASSMVAAALDPKPGWEVLDACAAPGNKTVHLAALMRGRGRIIACEINKDRIKRLEETIRLSGATNIEVLAGDFLSLDPKDPSFSEVCAILLDPSCSGSGTAAQRLDHLLPSYTTDVANTERLNRLATFQKKALLHALSFPAVERVVYSTCSVNQIENEDVVNSVLPVAASFGFELTTPFPDWQRRGLPVFEGSAHVLRTDPVEDKEGFFIALFVKKALDGRDDIAKVSKSRDKPYFTRSSHRNKRKIAMPIIHHRISKMWLHGRLILRRQMSHKPNIRPNANSRR